MLGSITHLHWAARVLPDEERPESPMMATSWSAVASDDPQAEEVSGHRPDVHDPIGAICTVWSDPSVASWKKRVALRYSVFVRWRPPVAGRCPACPPRRPSATGRRTPCRRPQPARGGADGSDPGGVLEHVAGHLSLPCRAQASAASEKYNCRTSGLDQFTACQETFVAPRYEFAVSVSEVTWGRPCRLRLLSGLQLDRGVVPIFG